MRIPLENRHYLTDAYINKFKLQTMPFYNVDRQGNCFVSIHGETVRLNGKFVTMVYSILDLNFRW